MFQKFDLGHTDLSAEFGFQKLHFLKFFNLIKKTKHKFYNP